MTITHKKTARQERRVATELGGRRVPLSGAGAEKGDGRVAQKFARTSEGITETVALTLRIENKLTGKTSYTLSYDDWDKLYWSAMRVGENALFHIELHVPGIGQVALAVITETFAKFLRLPAATPWTRRPAKSFNVTWARCNSGALIPFGLIMHAPGGTLHTLVIADYLTVRNLIQEHQ